MKTEIKTAITKELTDLSQECFLNNLIPRNVFEEKVGRVLDLYSPLFPSSEIERLKEENDKRCIEFAEWKDRLSAGELRCFDDDGVFIRFKTNRELLTLFNNRSNE